MEKKRKEHLKLNEVVRNVSTNFIYESIVYVTTSPLFNIIRKSFFILPSYRFLLIA
jgi:hypothetical protein